MKIEYLLLDLTILVFPVLAITFTHKAKFPNLSLALKSIIPVALIFVLVDFIVINWFWYFNPKYILGIRLFEVPLEELLFFIIIPFSCLSIWVNLKSKIKGEVTLKYLGYFSLFIFLISLWGAYYQKYYTFIIFFIFFAFILLTKNKKVQKTWVYIIPLTLILTFIFNLYLTARPIVLYNPSVISGLKIITIPMEDFVYGLILIISTIYIYEYKSSKRLS
jgi:lycopene cyclase domain-containing protein